MKFFYLTICIVSLAFVASGQCDDVTPSFSVDQTAFCGNGPHNLTITNTSTGTDAGTTQYEWTINGSNFATTSDLSAPTAPSLTTPGIYTLEVTAVGTPPACSQTFDLSVEVFPTPVADFTHSPSGDCAGIPVNFTNTSTGTIPGTTYNWSFGDGVTSTDENPSHTYAFGGTYTVALTVTNIAGCESTTNQTVTNQDIPNVFISGDDGDGNTTNCLLPGDPTTSQTVNFSNFTTGAVSYHWDFGDGTTSTGFEPSHTYSTYGTFPVTMTATGPNGCSFSQTIDIVFERFVSASMTLDITEYSGCLPHTLNSLQNLSVNATEFVWNFGDGTPSVTTTSLTPPSHVYNTPGSYTISLTASNSCNSANATISPIQIVGAPVANFNPSVSSGCAPQGISFSNTSTGASPANNYTWDMGNGNVYNNISNPPPQNYTNQGIYPITVTANNACGSDSYTFNMVIDSIPVAEIIADPIEGCSPLTVDIDNLSTGNINYYRWYRNGSYYSSAVNIGPFTYSYPAGNTPVTQNISLTVGNQCGSSSDAETITIHRPTLARFTPSATSVCLGTAVSFTNQSLGENLTFEWDLGNGTTSTSSTPGSVTYAAPGTYTVQLIANGYCGPDTVEHTITVNPLTVADFSLLTPDEGCSPLTVEFQNNSTGVGLSYNWTVDGVNSGTMATIPPITFTETPGNTPVNHIIRLTVNSACGTETFQDTIIVHRPTEANFTTSATSVCEGDSFTFTDASLGENLTWEWNFGDGATSNSQGPHTHTYTNPGTYTVQLIADGYCGRDTLETIVTINPLTVIDFTIPEPQEGCSPVTVSLANNSSGTGLTYEWTVDGGFYSNQQSPAPITFTEVPGSSSVTHIIELVVTGACGTETMDQTVIVHPPNQADFTVFPNEVCLGDAITVTDNSLGENLQWNYDFGDGSIATTAGPHVLNYASDGTYTIQLIAAGYCPNDTLEQTVTVHPYPVADITPDAPDGCQILDMTFTNNSTSGANYSWSFGTNASPATSTAFDPGTVQFSAAGTETISIQVEQNGCTSADTVYIDVYPLPVVAFTTNPSGGCNPLTVSFTNTSPDNGTETFTWDFDNGNTSSDYTPSDELFVALTNDSIYDITLTVTSGSGCSDSLTRQVIVNPLPVADFDFVEDTICLNETMVLINSSIGANNYSWDFGDGNTSTTTVPSYNYTTPGTYTVTLQVETTFGCMDVISREIVVDPIPEALFSNTTECLGYGTQFTDESTGNPVSWSWNFGDGNTSSDQHPLHQYTVAGSFTASLTVENSFSCSSSIAQSVLVNTVPTADFSAANFCLGDATQFNNLTSGATVAYEWNFGDGSPVSTATHPTHTYTAVGDYSVMLVAFGGSGCSDTLVQTVSITEVPVTNFTFTDVCQNDTTFFINQTTGNPDSYAWDFGNGQTTTATDPWVVYTANGDYTVTLTTSFTSSGCSHTISQTVTSFPRTSPNFSASTICLEEATSFTDQTTGNPVQWNWDFGDGTGTSTLQNPVYTYTNFGLYDVRLVTENAFGCSDTTLITVEVYPLPVANFTFDTVCLHTATQITDLSTDAIDWEYNWGDGTTVTTGADSPTHLYTSDGSFSVAQIVTNIHGCKDTLEQTVIIRPNPIADWEADTSCFSYLTSFTDLSTDAVSWSWDYDDNGSTSSQQNPTYTFSTDGTFTVSLIVENSFGCTDEQTQDVLVLPQPVASFNNTAVCAGSQVNFTNTSPGSPINFSWNFGDGTPEITSENPSHTYGVGGTYPITFIVENSAGCADTLEETIEVYTIPQIAFTADTVCLFNITTFTNNTTDTAPIAQWFWDFGDGNTSFAENPTYIYQTPGIFNVTLQVTNVNGCDSSIVAPVHVSEIPTADFSSDVVCFGSPTTFTDQSTGNPTQWVWDFGDGTVVDGGAIEQHTYTSPGNYIVTLLVVGGEGICNDQTFHIISVNEEATAGMTIPTAVCEGGTFNFADNSVANNGTITTYNWDMGDGTLYSTATGTHQYAQTGTYTITLTVTSSDGCSNTTTEQITVNPNPAPAFSATLACEGQTTRFTNLSPGTNTSWAWTFGDGNGSVLENPVHTYANDGTYTVTLTVTSGDGCSANVSQTVTVYPSPTAAFNSTTECWGEATSFTDLSTLSNGQIVSWEWIFGTNEAVSSSPNPQHTFEEYADNFDVQLVVTSDEGCTDTLVQQVNLHPVVNFNFVPDRTAGCQPVEVQFTDQSTTSGAATIISWHWDFGDGYYSFVQSPAHTFSDPGSYDVELTVVTSTDCEFVMPMPFSIDVYPKPQAGFSVTPAVTSIAFPHIEVSDESVGALDWEYAFGDGYYSNSGNPTHTYQEVGVYSIMQIVKSNYGCIDTAYQTIEVTEFFSFFAPNSFTPNGDGMNDSFEWAVQATTIFEIRIFNRWGEVIFKTNQQDDYWDGTYNGTPVQDGVYIWQVELMDMNGEWRLFRGHISVLR